MLKLYCMYDKRYHPTGGRTTLKVEAMGEEGEVFFAVIAPGKAGPDHSVYLNREQLTLLRDNLSRYLDEDEVAVPTHPDYEGSL